MFRRITRLALSLGAGLVLAGAGASAAFAQAPPNTGALPTSVVVSPATIYFTLNEASMSLTGLQGGKLQSTPITYSVQSTDALGYQVNVAGADFTGTAGTIPASELTDTYTVSGGHTGSGAVALSNTGTIVYGTTSAATDNVTETWDISAANSNAILPGTYSSTLMYTAIGL